MNTNKPKQKHKQQKKQDPQKKQQQQKEQKEKEGGHLNNGTTFNTPTDRSSEFIYPENPRSAPPRGFGPPRTVLGVVAERRRREGVEYPYPTPGGVILAAAAREREAAEVGPPASGHWAQYHPDLVPLFAELVPRPRRAADAVRVLDPMAGLGHRLAELGKLRPDVSLWGVELEPEYVAAAAPFVQCGDARRVVERFGRDAFDAVVVSPAYGNRGADQYVPPAHDESRRYGYAIDLGRPCTPGSGAGAHWGPRYRRIHAAVWAEVIEVLRPGGTFVLNVKDFVAAGERQHVTVWHAQVLTSFGLSLESVHRLGHASGIKDSPNRRRFPERVLVFKRRQ